MICLPINWKVHAPCNFNCLVKNEGLLKVTISYVRYKCNNISETIQDGVVITTEYRPKEVIYGILT